MFILSVAAVAVLPAFGQNSAQATISSAKDALKNAYEAVKQAQASGANVDSLMTTVNEAAASLSNAELFEAAGDSSSAFTYAMQAQSKLGGVASQAASLTQAAQTNKNLTSFANYVLLFAGIAVFAAGAIVWFVLEKRERRNLHGTSPI